MMNRLTIHQVESLPSRAMRHAVAVAIANAVYYIVVSHSCSCHSKSSVTQLQAPTELLTVVIVQSSENPPPGRFSRDSFGNTKR